MITVTLTLEQAQALATIADRYYFDLFKPIRVDTEEEYRFRNALLHLAKQINTQTKENKQ